MTPGRRATSEFAVALLIAATTASLGMLVDAAFPVGTSLPTWARALIFAVLVGTLSVAVVWRYRVHWAQGTLIYVELLPRGMRNLHAAAAQRAARSRQEFMQLVGQVPPITGPADWSEQVAALATGLGDAVNADTSRTRTEIASNMLWPAAVALGYAWRRPADVTVIELDDPRPGSTHLQIALDEVQRHARNQAVSLRDNRRPLDVAGVDVRESGSDPGGWRGLVVHVSGQVQLPLSVHAVGGPARVVELAVFDGPAVVALRFGRDDAMYGHDNRLAASALAARVAAEIVRLCAEEPAAPLAVAMRVPKSLAFAIGAALDVVVNEYWQASPREARLDVWGRLFVALHHTGRDFVEIRLQEGPAPTLVSPTGSTP